MKQGTVAKSMHHLSLKRKLALKVTIDSGRLCEILVYPYIPWRLFLGENATMPCKFTLRNGINYNWAFPYKVKKVSCADYKKLHRTTGVLSKMLSSIFNTFWKNFSFILYLVLIGCCEKAFYLVCCKISKDLQDQSYNFCAKKKSTVALGTCIRLFMRPPVSALIRSCLCLKVLALSYSKKLQNSLTYPENKCNVNEKSETEQKPSLSRNRQRTAAIWKCLLWTPSSDELIPFIRLLPPATLSHRKDNICSLG